MGFFLENVVITKENINTEKVPALFSKQEIQIVIQLQKYFQKSTNLILIPKLNKTERPESLWYIEDETNTEF